MMSDNIRKLPKRRQSVVRAWHEFVGLFTFIDFGKPRLSAEQRRRLEEVRAKCKEAP
jgi:hypothetical protein